MVEIPLIKVETINRMGIGITTTATMATADIRVTATEIKTTTATTIMAITTTAKMETSLEQTIRQTTAGHMDCVLTREQPAELLPMVIKLPLLEPTAWAGVGATSDPLDRYR